MRHVFKAKVMGWDNEYEGVWFDSSYYTKDEAEAQFVPFTGTNMREYEYTGYEYDGKKYHSFTYIGEFEDDEMPSY